MRAIYWAVAAALLAMPSVTAAQVANPHLRMFQRAIDFPGATPPTVDWIPLTVGKRSWQKLDFYPAKSAEPAPVVVFLDRMSTDPWVKHRLHEMGFALAVIRYQPTNEKAPDAVQTFIAGLNHLNSNAETLKIDASQIALVGRDVMANLAVLMGTDPALFEGTGTSFASIKAVVSFDGIGFDVPTISARSPYRASKFKRFYGSDTVQQGRYSSTYHLAAPNASRFLFLTAWRDETAADDTAAIVERMKAAGISADHVSMPEVVPSKPETGLLVKEDGAGAEVLELLAPLVQRATP